MYKLLRWLLINGLYLGYLMVHSFWGTELMIIHDQRSWTGDKTTTTKRHHAIACDWGCLIPISYSCSKHPQTESQSPDHCCCAFLVTFPLSDSVLVKHFRRVHSEPFIYMVSAADHTSLIISWSSSTLDLWFSPGNSEPLTPTWPDHGPPNPPTSQHFHQPGEGPSDTSWRLLQPARVSCSCWWLLRNGCKQWLRSHIQNITHTKQQA